MNPEATAHLFNPNGDVWSNLCYGLDLKGSPHAGWCYDLAVAKEIGEETWLDASGSTFPAEPAPQPYSPPGFEERGLNAKGERYEVGREVRIKPDQKRFAWQGNSAFTTVVIHKKKGEGAGEMVQ
ncbi:hypothetical protein STEG23_006847 [Scotinomys teguina]